MADKTDRLLRDYFSGRLKLMSEMELIHKQEIADITFCLSVLTPDHREVITAYYSDKFTTWDIVCSEMNMSNAAVREWRKDFKKLLNVILQHGGELAHLRQEALQA